MNWIQVHLDKARVYEHEGYSVSTENPKLRFRSARLGTLQQYGGSGTQYMPPPPPHTNMANNMAPMMAPFTPPPPLAQPVRRTLAPRANSGFLARADKSKKGIVIGGSSIKHNIIRML